MPSITTNIELADAARRNNIPLIGVFFKDKLPTHVYDGGYIFNLADHDDGEGSHWTSAWVEKDLHGKKHVVYFDPFAVAPPENVKRFFYAIDKTIFHGTKQVQNIDSFICGYFVLYFLWYMNRCKKQEKNVDKRFKNFESLWSTDVQQNRTLLSEYLKCLQ